MYWDSRLLEHAMKVFERVIEARVRKIVKIDSMQFGFMPGRGTTDAIFIVRQLQEKYLAKKKGLWVAFIDLEKAFPSVPRWKLFASLHEMGIKGHTLVALEKFHSNSFSAIRYNGSISDYFRINKGVREGSVLSPLLFVLYFDVLYYLETEALAAGLEEGLLEISNFLPQGCVNKLKQIP